MSPKTFSQLSLALLMIILVACRKQDLLKQNTTSSVKVDETKIQYKPQNESEMLFVENLSKLKDVFKTLYMNSENIKLVNAAIYARAYSDESVLVKDLIYPEQSRLSSNKQFLNVVAKNGLSLDKFASNFWLESGKANDAAFSTFLQTLKPVESSSSIVPNNTESPNGNSDVSIYFPYSEEFIEDNFTSSPSLVSLVAATADADEGIGEFALFNGNGQIIGYNQVLVNDEYASANPTHIIGVNGIEIWDNGGGISPLNAFTPGDPIDLLNLNREIKQVYVGSVRVNGHQYDKLISFTGNGGGSEIVFTRSDGFLKVLDGQVQADNFFTNKTVSKKSIRNENWVNFSYEWDGDWESANHRQILAIYEDDNRSQQEISGKISTTLKLSDQITITVDLISWKVTFKSDDALIKQLEMKRESFFVLNRTNLEGEMYEGWPVRDRHGDVSYTLNDRTYY